MSTPLLAIICGIGILAWTAVIYKGRALRRDHHNATVWAYWWSFVFLAAAVTLPLPPILQPLDGLTRRRGFAYFLSDTAALLTCWCWVAYLHGLNTPNPAGARAVRRLAGLIVGALGFMAARFALAPGRVEHQFGLEPTAIYLALYRLGFLGVIGLHLRHIIALLHDYAAKVRQQYPTLHRRLQLINWAAKFGVGFVGAESLRIVLPAFPQLPGALLMLATVLLLVTSLTLRSWMRLMQHIARRWPTLGRIYGWLRDFHACWRLYPLWRALYPVAPPLSFLPAPAPLGAWRAWRDVSFHLCRQVIEIRDWSLALRTYQQPDAADLARELSQRRGRGATELATLSEATNLALALCAWRETQCTSADQPPAQCATDVDSPHDAPMTGPAANELATLLQVAAHFARSPLIRRILAQPGQSTSPAKRSPSRGSSGATGGTTRV